MERIHVVALAVVLAMAIVVAMMAIAPRWKSLRSSSSNVHGVVSLEFAGRQSHGQCWWEPSKWASWAQVLRCPEEYHPCVAGGKDCSLSKCCTQPGMMCYEENAYFAACKYTCPKNYVQPGDRRNITWTCKELGKRAPGGPSSEPVGINQNCLISQACTDAGLQCFAKNEYVAYCQYNCTQYDPGRQGANWTCNPLGFRVPGGVPSWAWKHQPNENCSNDNSFCGDTGCCKNAEMSCYQKTPGAWAQCRKDCTPGVDKDDPSCEPWTCTKLTPHSAKHQPKVSDKAPELYKACGDTHCCAGAGLQCFEKADGEAYCKYNCSKHQDGHDDWTCNPLGARSPGLVPKKLWHSTLAANCTDDWGDCHYTGCCKTAEMSCFEKTAGHYAQCKPDCQPGVQEDDPDPKPWTCTKVTREAAKRAKSEHAANSDEDVADADDKATDTAEEATDSAEEPTGTAEEATGSAEEATGGAEDARVSAEEATGTAEEATGSAEDAIVSAEEATDTADEPAQVETIGDVSAANPDGQASV